MIAFEICETDIWVAANLIALLSNSEGFKSKTHQNEFN